LLQASSRQLPAGSAPPAGTGLQVPAVPSSPHDMHEPRQSVWQQRPWAQKPEAQSVGRLHSAPVGRLPQLPSTHTLGLAHWSSRSQPVRQRVPLQPRNGAQLRAGGLTHAPLWQVPAPVSALSVPLQRAARQVTPLA
jgi:hypothetical protein